MMLRRRMFEFVDVWQDAILDADASVAKFAANYDRYAAAGRWSADHNIPYLFKDARTGRMLPISCFLKYPSQKEFRNAFKIHMSAPRSIPVDAVEDYEQISVKHAAKYACDRLNELSDQLETAKQSALENAAKAMERAEKQLGKDGKRLHQTLIDDATRAAQQLRDITDGYEPDMILTGMAINIEKNIISVRNVDAFKHNETKRQEAHRAAKNISRELAKITKSFKNPQQDATTSESKTPVLSPLLQPNTDIESEGGGSINNWFEMEGKDPDVELRYDGFMSDTLRELIEGE